MPKFLALMKKIGYKPKLIKAKKKWNVFVDTKYFTVPKKIFGIVKDAEWYKMSNIISPTKEQSERTAYWERYLILFPDNFDGDWIVEQAVFKYKLKYNNK
jgi:hypothetical protein